MQSFGPERLAGQGLDPEQFESGNRAIHALLTDPDNEHRVDLVLTWRHDDEGGVYEAWSRRGAVRFRRAIDDDGALVYPIVEILGDDPLANLDPLALGSIRAESTAALASGHEADDPARRFIAPEQQSYPFAYERIAQLFDSPNAPDLAVSPTDWAQGPNAGNHGALHVRQARAPLWFCGPRIRAGEHGLAARAVDIAPTLLAACGFPKTRGADATGRSAEERGVGPDVYLARQDGRPLDEILDPTALPATRAYLFLLDGIHMTELDARLEAEPERYPGLLRLREHAARLGGGSIVNFPSITWPSHTTIGTGTWCGHHDVVNPSYYLRDKREMVSPQGQQVRTEGFSSSDVESIFEAFRRERADEGITAAIYAPFGRSADHAPLEGRTLGHKPRLKALTADLAGDRDPRWEQDGDKSVTDESILDNRGMAQVIELFTSDELRAPAFVYHELTLTDGAGHAHGPHGEGLGDALAESDRRVTRVLDLLAERGLLEETLFVLTADHGMAPQDPDVNHPVSDFAANGFACAVAEPMIWLHDLCVRVERFADGRTARVFVSENDALPDGSRPEVEGARVRVEARGETPREVATGETGPGGVYGFPTPSNLPSHELIVTVEAPGFNPRRLTLDGTPLALDLGRALYSLG